jgi:hypothetical protein
MRMLSLAAVDRGPCDFVFLIKRTYSYSFHQLRLGGQLPDRIKEALTEARRGESFFLPKPSEKEQKGVGKRATNGATKNNTVISAGI